MRRRQLLMGSGLIAATTLAGCLSSAQEGDAEVGGEESDRTVTVRASGESAADPDLAVLQVGVEAAGDDPAAVRDELTSRAADLEAALLEYGIDEDDVTTDRFRIRERVDERAMQEDGVDPRSEEDLEEYRHYRGTHAYAVEVHDVDAVGDVIDVAVDAGADEVGRIEFTLSDDRREELREDALEEALAEARTEADFVAAEVDASVVDAEHVDTSGADVRPAREQLDMEAYEADDADAGTQLQPDDVSVSASVTVQYEVE